MERGELTSQPLIDVRNPNDPEEIFPSADIYLGELSDAHLNEQEGDFTIESETDTLGQPQGESFPDEVRHPVDEMYLIERAVDIEAVLAELPEREREILLMRAVEGKPFAEIAAEVGMSKSWVQSHYIDARVQTENFRDRHPWDLSSYHRDLDSI